MRGGALIQALCASAPLFYYFFRSFYVVHRYYPSFCHVHPVNKHCDDDDDDDIGILFVPFYYKYVHSTGLLRHIQC